MRGSIFGSILLTAFLAVSIVAIADTPAHADEGDTLTAAWLLPEGATADSDFEDLFPQTLHGTSATGIPELECGRTYQFDMYRDGSPEDHQRTTALVDGKWLGIVRGNPIDAGLHVQDGVGPSGWWFETGPECVTELAGTGAGLEPVLFVAVMLLLSSGIFLLTRRDR